MGGGIQVVGNKQDKAWIISTQQRHIQPPFI